MSNSLTDDFLELIIFIHSLGCLLFEIYIFDNLSPTILI